MFANDKFYATNSPALLTLGQESTLRHWRSQGVGPN